MKVYSHYAHSRPFWSIETCGPCVRHRNNRHPDSYRACDLVALKQSMNETLGKVGQIMTGMTNDYHIDFSAALSISRNLEAYHPLTKNICSALHQLIPLDEVRTVCGSMLRLAYSVLQNIALRVSIISNYPDIQIDLRNVAGRLNTMLCNIDRILRSGSFYRNIEFPECRLEDHIFSNRFRNVTSTYIINYVVNSVVYSRNNLEYLIGNINNILLNI